MLHESFQADKINYLQDDNEVAQLKEILHTLTIYKLEIKRILAYGDDYKVQDASQTGAGRYPNEECVFETTYDAVEHNRGQIDSLASVDSANSAEYLDEEAHGNVGVTECEDDSSNFSSASHPKRRPFLDDSSYYDEDQYQGRRRTYNDIVIAKGCVTEGGSPKKLVSLISSISELLFTDYRELFPQLKSMVSENARETNLLKLRLDQFQKKDNQLLEKLRDLENDYGSQIRESEAAALRVANLASENQKLRKSFCVFQPALQSIGSDQGSSDYPPTTYEKTERGGHGPEAEFDSGEVTGFTSQETFVIPKLQLGKASRQSMVNIGMGETCSGWRGKKFALEDLNFKEVLSAIQAVLNSPDGGSGYPELEKWDKQLLQSLCNHLIALASITAKGERRHLRRSSTDSQLKDSVNLSDFYSKRKRHHRMGVADAYSRRGSKSRRLYSEYSFDLSASSVSSSTSFSRSDDGGGVNAKECSSHRFPPFSSLSSKDPYTALSELMKLDTVQINANGFSFHDYITALMRQSDDRRKTVLMRECERLWDTCLRLTEMGIMYDSDFNRSNMLLEDVLGHYNGLPVQTENPIPQLGGRRCASRLDASRRRSLALRNLLAPSLDAIMEERRARAAEVAQKKSEAKLSPKSSGEDDDSGDGEVFYTADQSRAVAPSVLLKEAMLPLGILQRSDSGGVVQRFEYTADEEQHVIETFSGLTEAAAEMARETYVNVTNAIEPTKEYLQSAKTKAVESASHLLEQMKQHGSQSDVVLDYSSQRSTTTGEEISSSQRSCADVSHFKGMEITITPPQEESDLLPATKERMIGEQWVAGSTSETTTDPEKRPQDCRPSDTAGSRGGEAEKQEFFCDGVEGFQDFSVTDKSTSLSHSVLVRPGGNNSPERDKSAHSSFDKRQNRRQRVSRLFAPKM